MPAPKKAGTKPVAQGVRWVKKAHMWLYYENFNSTQSPDVFKYFATKEEAEQALDEARKADLNV